MGTEEPLELEVLVYEANVRCGQPAVSPYEHKLATPAQRARAEAEFAALLEQTREQVRQEEALLRGDQMDNKED